MKNIKVVNNIHIIPRVAAGLVSNTIRNPAGFRFGVIRSGWNLLKTQAARTVENIEAGRIAGIAGIEVSLTVNSYDRAVLCAMSRLVRPKTFFEIGTYLGETTLALARNNPEAQIYTLDLPSPGERKSAALEMTDEYLFERWDRGSAFKGTPESGRITALTGDSATFDFSPYAGRIDMAFIDASHSYSYVKADTEAALSMLSPQGVIAWHDYPAYPGIYAYLNELGATPGRKIYHITGTGLAFSGGKNLVN